jgi:micrococcal nuclease
VALRRWHLLLLLLPVLAAGSATADPVEGTVVRVVDGDTIHVQLINRVEKIRYIGVNAPEIHHPTRGEEPGGREATEVNRQLVVGRRVRLELDVRTRDRHGRLLAYVWAGDTMVNAELIRRGYAQVMTVPPNVRYQGLFLKLQREAQNAHRGLWQQAAKKGPSASLAPSAAGSPYREYGSPAAFGRRLAAGPFLAACQHSSGRVAGVAG